MAKKKTSPQALHHYTARAADLKIVGYVEAASAAEALKKARKLYDAASVEARAADHANGQAPASQPAVPRKAKDRGAKTKAASPTATPTPAEASTAADVATERRRKPSSAKRRSTGTAAKVSALDAAAKVLEEAGQPLSCAAMIAAMADKGYWTSPAGKTPAATLYSGILRELNTKGEASRFRKTGRGQFAHATTSV
jgi:hypothetical protein